MSAMRRASTLLATLLLASSAAAQPSAVLYQGFLTDSGGQPVEDTSLTMHFKIYPTATGGTASWSETVNGVDIVAGSFAVELTMSAADLTQDDLWLGLAIDNPANELPRMRLGSVPFALVGGGAAGLAGSPAAAYQRVTTGSCAADEGIAAVDAMGNVVCEADDANGVAAVVGGVGLVETGTSGSVQLDVVPGDGLFVGPGLGIDFGGPGLSPSVSRSDHDHAGTFIPAGTMTTCAPNGRVTALDPFTGDVSCGPDLDTTYTASGQVFMTPDPTGTYDYVMDMDPDVVAGASVVATNYYVNPSQYGTLSFHPADFDPTDSSYPFYIAPSNDAGRLISPGSINVNAPIHFPTGSTMGVLYMYYELQDPGDQICCSIYGFEVATGFQTIGNGLCSFGQVGLGVFFEAGNLGWPVDNFNVKYSLSCTLNDGNTAGDLALVGVTMGYDYSTLVR